MKEIDKIIKSKYQPKDKNVLWDNGENLMINRNGKWESANNELPDGFKGWSGAANFLNNNDEPGGMIGMPFGYGGGETFSKEVNLQPNERALICNLNNSWHYNNVIVVIEGVSYELILTAIEDTEFQLNGYYIIYESNTRDFYVQARPWMPLIGNVTVKTYTGKIKLSNEWIDIESLSSDWQNNNQDSTDYIKNRTHYISSKDEQSYIGGIDITFNIIPDVNAYCYAYDRYGRVSETILIKNDDTSTKTLKTESFTAVIYRTAENSSIFHASANGADPSSIKFVIFTVKTLDDYYIPDNIARKTDIASDWDSNVEEFGYIKNRPFYYNKIKDLEAEVSDNYTEAYSNNGSFNSNITIRATLQNSIEYLRLRSPNVIYSMIVGSARVDAYCTFNNTSRWQRIYYKIINGGGVKDISIGTAKCLNDSFIPNTIARTADYELPHITFYDHKETDNLELLSSLTPGYSYSCDLYSTYKTNNTRILENGEYFNGVITGIKEGKFVQYNVDLATGVISEKANIDIVELYNKVEAITSNN